MAGRSRVSIPGGTGAPGLCRSHTLKNRRGQDLSHWRRPGGSLPGPPRRSLWPSPSSGTDSSPIGIGTGGKKSKSQLPSSLAQHGGCGFPGKAGGAVMGPKLHQRRVRRNRPTDQSQVSFVIWASSRPILLKTLSRADVEPLQEGTHQGRNF